MQILFLVYLGDKIIKQTDTLSPSDQLVFKETEGAEENVSTELSGADSCFPWSLPAVVCCVCCEE